MIRGARGATENKITEALPAPAPALPNARPTQTPVVISERKSISSKFTFHDEEDD